MEHGSGNDDAIETGGRRRPGRGARWAVPAVAVLAAGGVIAGITMSGAQAAPALPARSAATLLADVQRATGPGPMTATVQSIASLGLPALPSSGDSPSSGLSLLSGMHTFNIWYADPTHVRVAEPVQLGESDFRRDGRQVWLWNSKTQTATHVVLPSCARSSVLGRPVPRLSQPSYRPRRLTITRLPGAKVRITLPGGKTRIVPLSRLRDHLPLAGTPKFRDGAGGAVIYAVHRGCVPLPQRASHAPAGPEPTPQQVARQILAAVGPTTTVSVQQNVSVAGQAAYQLALAPQDHRSLIGRITIAIDAARHFPLRVQVFARGSGSPAFQLGFTALSFGRPAASNFTFTPPPGAKVKKVTVPATPVGALGSAVPCMPITAPHGSLYARPKDSISASSTGVIGTGSANGGGFVNIRTPGRPRVMGSGWLSVLVVPPDAALGPTTTYSTYGSHPTGYSRSITITASPPGAAGGPAAGLPVLRALLHAATPVHGTWGSGRLLRTALVSALITSKGTVLIGAVTPSVLYADAAAIK